MIFLYIIVTYLIWSKLQRELLRYVNKCTEIFYKNLSLFSDLKVLFLDIVQEISLFYSILFSLKPFSITYWNMCKIEVPDVWIFEKIASVDLFGFTHTLLGLHQLFSNFRWSIESCPALCHGIYWVVLYGIERNIVDSNDEYIMFRGK